MAKKRPTSIEPTVTFWGAARTVTGSMHRLDARGQSLLLDCGLFQGPRAEARRRNLEDEPLNGGFSYPGGVRRLTISPDGQRLGVVGLTSMHILDLDGKKQLDQAGRAFGVAFDPQGQRLAWSQEKDLVAWDFAAGGIVHRIVVDQLGLFGIGFLAEGKQLVSGGCNGWVGLWDLTA